MKNTILKKLRGDSYIRNIWELVRIQILERFWFCGSGLGLGSPLLPVCGPCLAEPSSTKVPWPVLRTPFQRIHLHRSVVQRTISTDFPWNVYAVWVSMYFQNLKSCLCGLHFIRME